MRWADLDMLGHVNNVVYVDYLQEARVDMLRKHGAQPHGHVADDLAEGVVVVRHEVTYLRPLTFSFRPVSIECWVTAVRAASFTMAYEIYRAARDDPDDREVYVRASTVLSPYLFADERPRRLSSDERRTLEQFLEPVERRAAKSGPVPPSDIGHYPVHVRFSDVDVYGHVNNVKYLEYFQEARIVMTSRVWRELRDEGGSIPSIVVAQTDVDYRRPILFRSEPYDCWSVVRRVGTRSMTIESEIGDADQVLSRARVVIVFFDQRTGRSVEPPPSYRDRLLAMMPTP
jgi:acyl-CoA thioester hydrolase